MNRNDNEMRRSEGDTSEKLPAPTVSQPSMPEQVEKSPPKKKRKSPAVPWKKPKDMPKRPLSAYNLFFKAEREKLIEKLSAGPRKGKAAEDEETTEEPDEEEAAAILECVDSPGSAGSKKQMKTSGLGFANLAKTIASKWKTLDPKERAPFEERASTDKQRYDVEVGKWRVKQKAEQSQKKAAEEAMPQKDAPREPQSTSLTLSPGLVEALSAVEPYPAEWFDVVGSASGGQAAVESSRPFEDSHTTFESSQRSLDYSGSQQMQHEYLPMGFPSHGGYHLGPLPGVPFPPDQAPHQAAFSPWSINDMRRAEVPSREIPYVVNLHPKYSQSREGLASHEFAQAIPGESVARLSPQFRTTQPPSPQLRYLDRDEQRMVDAYSWGISGNWGQQGNLSGLTIPPSQATSYQFDPLPFDATSGAQYPSTNRSFSILPQNPEGQFHQFGGPLSEAGSRRHTWAATEPSRIRHTAASSLDPMPQLYRPDNPSGQLDSRSPHTSHTSQAISDSLPSGPGQRNAGVQVKPDSATQSDQSSQQPFLSSQVASGQQARFQEISQRLDDETIDFITGLPFP